MSGKASTPRRGLMWLLLGSTALLAVLTLLGRALSRSDAFVRGTPPHPSPPPIAQKVFRAVHGEGGSRAGLEPDSPPPAVRKAQIVVPYGSGEGALGMVRIPQQPPVGPESFAVDPEGNILVADLVNHRLMVWSRDGVFRRAMAFPQITLNDVMTDAWGRIYLYDHSRRTLYLADPDGTLKSALVLEAADIDTRGYFHVINDRVFFANAAAQDVLVATVEQGKLMPPPPGAKRLADGIHAPSGRIYHVGVDRDQALRLRAEAPVAHAIFPELEVPLPGIVSARFVGEDQAQRFYVQTERLVGNRVVLEVMAFNPDGAHLATTQMPENDYALWTAKLVDVLADGTIVQFLPQRDVAQLNLFGN